jgi:class 3 adenylate cyclase/tetratricopeptide (TPR) repeat protein
VGAVSRAETRKLVTVVFADVTGSTTLSERLDPESMRGVMQRYFDEMRAALERHGGTVEKFIGDAVMAVFGIPSAHEDDALRAARAAVEMRDRLNRLNSDLQRDFGVRLENRIGIDSGEVVAGAGETLVTGDAVNVAARLEQVAAPGEILVGEPTRRLLRDAVDAEPAGPLALKGKAEVVNAFRLHGIHEASSTLVRRRSDAALVGRAGELELLRSAFDRTVGECGSFLVTLVGAAGVGKSRLAGEFLMQIAGEARVLHGRCLPYGDGITYWPLAQLVREAAGITSDLSEAVARERLSALLSGTPQAGLICEHLAAAIGLGGSAGATEETAWAARRLLETLAAGFPLVVVFDDLQWAEPTFLDLVEYVIDWSSSARILLVATARPDLLDVRPAWAGGRRNAISLVLEALDSGETEELIDRLRGEASLPPALRQRIVAATGGNPLFVEEMLGMLDDTRTDVPIPPSIQALLAARLDQLPEPERRTLECAAVVGQEFSREALVGLGDDATEVPGLLQKELIRATPSAAEGQDAFAFRHLLIRDAAYAAISKKERVRLHERFAGWLETMAGERLGEYEEIVGYHLEQAHRYLTELGPVDQHGRALAQRAALHLRWSGRRASARGDIGAAALLLKRALELLPGDAESCVALGAVQLQGGELQNALDSLDSSIAAATSAGRRDVFWEANLHRAQLAAQTDPTISIDLPLETAEEAIPELVELDKPGLLALAWNTAAQTHLLRMHHEPMLAALDRCLEFAQRAEDLRLESDAVLGITTALWAGPTPAGLGISRCEQLLARGHGPLGDAAAGLCIASLRFLRGEADLVVVADARAAVRELGFMPFYYGTAMVTAWMQSARGELATAEATLREGIAGLQAMGETGLLSTLAGLLANNLCDQRRFEEVEGAVLLAERTAAAGDINTVALVRSAQARLAASRGDFAGASKLIRSAVEALARTDALNELGRTHLWQADVEEASGHPDTARVALESARTLFETKESRPMLETTMRRLAGVG